MLQHWKIWWEMIFGVVSLDVAVSEPNWWCISGEMFLRYRGDWIRWVDQDACSPIYIWLSPYYARNGMWYDVKMLTVCSPKKHGYVFGHGYDMT